MKISSEGRARLQLLGSALLFSTGGAAIKACALGPWQIASFRSGIAAIALLACVPTTRRGWTCRAGVTGVAYAATLVTFVLGNKLGPAANAIFLQSTAPLYLLFLAPLVLNEKIRRRDLAVFAFVGFGAFLLLGGTSEGTRSGNIVSTLSGFTWAWTMVGLRWLAKRESGGTAEASVTLGNAIAFAACLPLAMEAFKPAVQDIAMLLYLGIFQIGLAYALLVKSVKKLPAIEVATMLLVEPVFNPVWAWIFHDEKPGLRVISGGAAILTGAFVGSLSKDGASNPEGQGHDRPDEGENTTYRDPHNSEWQEQQPNNRI